MDAFEVEVSYPSEIDLGHGPEMLPNGLSTLFLVTWEDEQDAGYLQAQTHLRNLVVHRALEAINKLFQAYKLVRIGHIDGCGVRTVGIYDTLFYFSEVDGKSSRDQNVRWRRHVARSYAVSPQAPSFHDPFDTSALAIPHIGGTTYPVARRYIRCYELLEHGFYSEAFIIAFSVMDDIVQEMLHEQLNLRGMSSKTDRDDLLRGIKENRLKLYLGPVLKLATGKSISELWDKSEKALKWINKTRNEIAHAGFNADYNAAAVGIYACIKLLHTLHSEGLLDAEFPVQFFRHAKITACWTLNPPEWVPNNEQANKTNYES
ncbi:hypothetical protein [Leptolyngbya sp. ST-U4]|uniref:hypothetical protein n=1 Tax=Leptolyngbya sp. ST-U4 TaxID=2933912 RepID=UPI003298A903